SVRAVLFPLDLCRAVRLNVIKDYRQNKFHWAAAEPISAPVARQSLGRTWLCRLGKPRLCGGLTPEIRHFGMLSDPNDIHGIETTTKSPNRADDIARHSYAGGRESSYRIANRWATIRSRGTAMKPATRQSIAGITVAVSLAAAIPCASRAQQNP